MISAKYRTAPLYEFDNNPLEHLGFELKIRRYSKATSEVYLYHNRRFLRFIEKSPKYVKESDIKRYISALIDAGLDSTSINLTISALKFYYCKIMHRRFMIPKLKMDMKMQSVLSRSETRRFFSVIRNHKHRVLFDFLYSAGLRVGEAILLRWSDLDLERGIGYVRCGKGAKDRTFLLSRTLLSDLKAYPQTSQYIFPTRKSHYTERSVQELCKRYAELAGIEKNITPHSFRRSFGTHLIESGHDVFVVMRMLGHKHISTTQRYINQAKIDICDFRNPLDELDL